MAIDVTSIINNFVNSNPQLSANVKGGISAATAVFNSLQSSNLNASTLLGGVSGLGSGVTGTGSVSATQQTAAQVSNTGIDQAKKQSFVNGADRELLTSPTAPIGVPLIKVRDSIPMLLQSEVQALMIQLAWMNSGDDFTYNVSPRIGRYAVHNKTLINYGYKDSSGNYLGKNGVTTDFEFTYGTEAQDRVMEKFLQDQYRSLIKVGAIRDGDTKETVAGMLAVAYQFQDANPSITNILGALNPITGLLSNGGDTSGLVSTATSLATSLASSLVSGSGATPSSVQGLLASSGVLSNAQTLLNVNPTAAVAATGSVMDKAALPSISGIVSTATTAAKSIAASLSSELTSAQAMAKKAIASVDVSKLTATANSLSSDIPANKAKEWRLTGTATDSQGKSGAVYYNAGKYAIQVLSST
jgi:hypothetical protein